MQNVEYTEVKENLINKILVILSIVVIPAVISSVVRYFQIGWQPTFWLHVIVIPTLVIFAYYKKLLSLSVKTLFLIILCFALSIFGFLDYSLSSSGIEYLMMGVLVTVVFFGKKTGEVVYFISIFIIDRVRTTGEAVSRLSHTITNSFLSPIESN